MTNDTQDELPPEKDLTDEAGVHPPRVGDAFPGDEGLYHVLRTGVSRILSRTETRTRPQLSTKLAIVSVGVRDLQAELAKDGRDWEVGTDELSYDEQDRAVQYVDHALRFVQSARRALDENDRGSFWQYLTAAKQWELAAWEELTGPGSDPLQKRAQQVLVEAAEILPADQREEVESLLLTESGLLRDDVGYDHVYEAVLILHEQYLNDYRTQRRLHALVRQFQSFMLTTIVALGGIFWGFEPAVRKCTKAEAKNPMVQEALATCTWTDPKFFEMMNVSSLLTTVVLFGVLGASVSGLLSLSNVLGEAHIPERVGSYWLVIGRVVTGGATALIFAVFLVSGIPDQFLRLDIATPNQRAPLLLAVAFISGFSERLLLRTINTTIGVATPPGAPASATTQLYPVKQEQEGASNEA